MRSDLVPPGGNQVCLPTPEPNVRNLTNTTVNSRESTLRIKKITASLAQPNKCNAGELLRIRPPLKYDTKAWLGLTIKCYILATVGVTKMGAVGFRGCAALAPLAERGRKCSKNFLPTGLTLDAAPV